MYTRSSSTSFLLLLVLGHVWVVSGCDGDATGAAGENPMHYQVVCVSRADAQTETCHSTESLSLFNTWVKEAISLPHSTFTIWIVETSRHQYRHVFTACVPTHWRAPVWQAKADFIMRARQAVSGTQQGQTVPDECRPPEPETPGMHQLAVFSAEASLRPDVLEKVASASPAPPLHQGVICDVSASTLGIACNATALLIEPLLEEMHAHIGQTGLYADDLGAGGRRPMRGSVARASPGSAKLPLTSQTVEMTDTDIEGRMTLGHLVE